MPRTKGSRNKDKILVLDERMDTVQREIAEMKSLLKEKKALLKQLNSEKTSKDQEAILNAVACSGKSFEEIMVFLRGEETPAEA